ncbi:hypothetical protein Glo7428_2958 [Gloeocapsa sp. PCC 7428]|uniref:DUF6335 family protein n=1 Tax=Gloeocapsa sp. PCC 7428 TaxID=1173026 RepID=UPI0002A61A55|nr:DUF6335 family protein [Gloeocapsa sp. PCC 7428]AFZ31450.1 hypothetical protein Glo7428_2958 [Gloeocapsa sp. PCC 7428]
MADFANKADNEPNPTEETNLSDIPIEDTDLVSDIPVEDSDEPIISELPEEITESYGTGVALEPGLEIGGRTMHDRMKQYTSASPELTGGDIDARWDQAEMVGDEAVGGTVATPDQDIVEELGTAVGLDYDDGVSLQTNDILEARDFQRWELDPMSSEDYQEH